LVSKISGGGGALARMDEPSACFAGDTTGDTILVVVARSGSYVRSFCWPFLWRPGQVQCRNRYCFMDRGRPCLRHRVYLRIVASHRRVLFPLTLRRVRLGKSEST